MGVPYRGDGRWDKIYNVLVDKGRKVRPQSLTVLALSMRTNYKIYNVLVGKGRRVRPRGPYFRIPQSDLTGF